MNPERQFYNQPIRSLQTMLRAIALFSDAYERIVPDGIYGPETQAAISTFQRNRGLPVTGVTDRHTWDEIVRKYDEAKESLSPAQPVYFDMLDEFPYSRGDHSARVKMAQCMLCWIADRYACVCSPELSGKMDEMMVNSVSEFQNLSGLPVTGKLDKTTWKHLVLQFVMSEIMQKSTGDQNRIEKT